MGAGKTELPEQTLFLKVKDIVVEGTIDLFDSATRTLYDFKTTSVYKWKEKDFAEWEMQLNAYKTMLSRYEKVEHLKLVLVFRDFRAFEKERYAWYPEKQIIVVEVEMFPDEIVQDFLEERVALWKKNMNAPDEKLTQCTDAETWNGKRCERYCPVAKFCAQNNLNTKRAAVHA